MDRQVTLDKPKSAPPRQIRHGRVNWSINGRGSGRGDWIDIEAARAVSEVCNERYGAGTHWVELR